MNTKNTKKICLFLMRALLRGFHSISTFDSFSVINYISLHGNCEVFLLFFFFVLFVTNIHQKQNMDK